MSPFNAASIRVVMILMLSIVAADMAASPATAGEGSGQNAPSEVWGSGPMAPTLKEMIKLEGPIPGMEPAAAASASHGMNPCCVAMYERPPVATNSLPIIPLSAPLHSKDRPVTTPKNEKRAPSNAIRLQVDDGFTADQLTKIMRVIGEWNAALAGQRRIEFVETAGDWHLTADQSPPVYIPPGQRQMMPVGMTDPAARTISIFVQRQHICGFPATLRHEFGHMLGLGHMTEGVMFPSCIDSNWSHINRETAVTARGLSQAVPGPAAGRN